MEHTFGPDLSLIHYKIFVHLVAISMYTFFPAVKVPSLADRWPEVYPPRITLFLPAVSNLDFKFKSNGLNNIIIINKELGRSMFQLDRSNKLSSWVPNHIKMSFK